MGFSGSWTSARAWRQRGHGDPQAGGGHAGLVRRLGVHDRPHGPRGTPLRRRADSRRGGSALLGPPLRARHKGHRARRLRVQREDPARPARALRDSPERGEDEDPEGTSDQGGGRSREGSTRPAWICPTSRTSATPSSSPTSWTRRISAPASRSPSHDEPRTFMGYRRGAGRGVGTRNYVVVMGVTSRLTGFVRALELEMNGVADAYENVDGIVCVAHTEGGEERTPNNLDLLLRTLGGFMVNPNVGAVLVLDHGGEEAVTNRMLRAYLEEHDYPIDDVPHEFMSLEGSFRRDLERAKSVVQRMVGGGGRGAAHRGACFGAQDRAAVRGVGRLLGGLREPARGVGERGGRQERRQRQPGRDGRVDRGRALRPAERQGPRNRAAIPLDGRAVQGARLAGTATRPRTILPGATTTAGSTTSPSSPSGPR